jgi:hypothetical protein
MKRALIACALAIPLSGCFASNDQSVDGGASNWQAIIQGARSLTQTWCLFDPDGDVLLRLILTGDSALQTAQGLAQAVCRVVNAQPKTVKAKSGALVPVAPKVRGVIITGRRI